MDKNFFLYISPPIIQAVMGILVVIPVTTYYLEPKDFGLVALLTAIATPVISLSATGDSWVLSGNWHRVSSVGKKELLFNLLLANGSLKLLWVCIFGVASYFALPILIKDYQPVYLVYFMLILSGLFLNTFWSTVSYYMVLEKAAATDAVIESLQWLSGVVTVIVCLAVLDLGVLSLFLSPIFVGVTSILLSILYLRDKLLVCPKKEWMSEIFHEGIPIIPFSLTESLNNSLDRILIHRWVDLSPLGLYAHSQNYRSIFLVGSKAYFKTMIPHFLEYYASSSMRLKAEFHRKMILWYMEITVIGVLVALYHLEIVHLLAHGKFDGASFLLPVWFFLVLTQSMGVPQTQYILQRKQNRMLVKVSVLMNLATLCIMVAMTYGWGIVGAAWSAIIGSLLLNYSRYFLAKRYGCPLGVEKAAPWSFLVIGTVYLSGLILPMSFMTKGIIMGITFLIFLGMFIRIMPWFSSARLPT